MLVPGESRLAADIGAVLERGTPADLASLGVEWVVFYPDDPDAALVDTDGLEQVVDGEHVRLYRVPSAVARDDADPGARALAVWGARLAALLLATAAALVVASPGSGRVEIETRSRRSCSLTTGNFVRGRHSEQHGSCRFVGGWRAHRHRASCSRRCPPRGWRPRWSGLQPDAGARDQPRPPGSPGLRRLTSPRSGGPEHLLDPGGARRPGERLRHRVRGRTIAALSSGARRRSPTTATISSRSSTSRPVTPSRIDSATPPARA